MAAKQAPATPQNSWVVIALKRLSILARDKIVPLSCVAAIYYRVARKTWFVHRGLPYHLPIAEASAEGAALAAADCPSVTVYKDYSELLEKQTLDVIDIVLPNHLRFDAV